jgi:hypothetical protein
MELGFDFCAETLNLPTPKQLQGNDRLKKVRIPIYSDRAHFSLVPYLTRITGRPKLRLPYILNPRPNQEHRNIKDVRKFCICPI